uniref:Uncharacterized protein n=1 Tax=Anguilla anguilla TaxID=7936 RepID=A0A0E9XUE0_ANGAN
MEGKKHFKIMAVTDSVPRINSLTTSMQFETNSGRNPFQYIHFRTQLAVSYCRPSRTTG